MVHYIAMYEEWERNHGWVHIWIKCVASGRTPSRNKQALSFSHSTCMCVIFIEPHMLPHTHTHAWAACCLPFFICVGAYDVNALYYIHNNALTVLQRLPRNTTASINHPNPNHSTTLLSARVSTYAKQFPTNLNKHNIILSSCCEVELAVSIAMQCNATQT